MRLVVDCQRGDTSAIFHRDILDDPSIMSKEWGFDSDQYGLQVFDTEEAAAKAQREYRIARGFDPITGEK